MNGRSREKQVALIRFVLRMTEDSKGGCDLVILIGGKSALGTSLDEEVRGCDVMITGSILDDIQDENGEATRCEHYGGGSSNQVALDVAGEMFLETTLDVTELEVGCPGKVESGDGSKEGA
ncbi:hypothetical protein Tco_1268240 [Tanacetum coccineum]